jgi:hypothetical protein
MEGAMYVHAIAAGLLHPVVISKLTITILVVALSARIAQTILKSRGKLSPRLEEILDRLYVAFIFSLGMEALRTNGDVILDNFRRFIELLIRRLGEEVFEVVVVLVVAAIGIGAYFFKKEQQKWYGIVEVIVGITTAGIVATSLRINRFDWGKWATLAGSAYVIARGLGNYREGKEPQPKSTRPATA